MNVNAGYLFTGKQNDREPNFRLGLQELSNNLRQRSLGSHTHIIFTLIDHFLKFIIILVYWHNNLQPKIKQIRALLYKARKFAYRQVWHSGVPLSSIGVLHSAHTQKKLG